MENDGKLVAGFVAVFFTLMGALILFAWIASTVEEGGDFMVNLVPVTMAVFFLVGFPWLLYRSISQWDVGSLFGDDRAEWGSDDDDDWRGFGSQSPPDEGRGRNRQSRPRPDRGISVEKDWPKREDPEFGR